MSVNLTNAINGYKVPASAGDVLYSSRSTNPYNITCYVASGTDLAGREVPEFGGLSTRTSGCNSALDQIKPENDARPNYIEFLQIGPYSGNLDLGLNQITGTMALPKSNPMSLPSVQFPESAQTIAPPKTSNESQNITVPIMTGESSAPISEKFTPTFGFTMPVKTIPGQRPAKSAEHYSPPGSFDLNMGKLIRRSSVEHFTPPAVTNSYTLADRLKMQEHYERKHRFKPAPENYVGSYESVFDSTPKYPKVTEKYKFAQKLSTTESGGG